MLPKEIEKDVWKEAITRYESEVMWSTATLHGGRKKGESVLEYATRARALQREAMDKLEYALWRAKEADGIFEPQPNSELVPPITDPAAPHEISRDRIYYVAGFPKCPNSNDIKDD